MHKPELVRKRLAATALLAAAVCPFAAAQALAATPLPNASAPVSATVSAAASPAASTAASTAHPADAPELAARFRVTWTPSGQPAQVQQWQLQRSATVIGWIKGDGREDVWRRDPSGIRLERVLRRDRHLIDYSAGELRTLGVQTDWPALGSLFDPADLARLQRLPDPRPGAWPHYRGVLDGEQVELRWDPLARLPVQLMRSSKIGQVRYQRSALSVPPAADWPRAGAGTEDFQRLDAADFGDMADNPVVRREEARDAQAGWRKPHPH